ncbi:FtsW/RodA/SpoVE family cell cycle protein [Paenibacillus sp. strain BS8-2]
MNKPKYPIMEHPAVLRYLDDVCAPVKAKSVHEDIRLEMAGHLEEIVEEYMEQEGRGLDEAVAAALRQMGDPHVVGEGLHAAHRPRTEWGMIAMLTLLVGVALVSMFSLQSSSMEQNTLVVKLISGSLGLVFLVVIYFTDYRKLLRLSWPLYGGTLLLLVIAQVQGTQINGADQWIVVGNMGLNVYSMSPYLFLIAFAGILQLDKERQAPTRWGRRLWLLLRDVIVYGSLPVYFYIIAPSMAQFMIYAAGFMILMVFSGRMKQVIVVLSGLAATAAILIYSFNYHQYVYIWDRLFGALSKSSAGYYASGQMLEAIQSAGLWGHGFGSHTIDIPFANSDMMFAYLIYSMGWVFGTGLAVLALLLAYRMIGIGLRLKDGYASKLVIGITAVLALRLVWNILMCLGLLPILGISMPIVLWSSGSIVEFAAIGLVLSAYRRKDMMSSRDYTGSATVLH